MKLQDDIPGETPKGPRVGYMQLGHPPFRVTLGHLAS